MNATAAQTKSLEWLNRLRANPKIPLIVAGSAAVAVMVALILWAKAPDYQHIIQQSFRSGWWRNCQPTDANEYSLPLQRSQRRY